MFRVLNKNRGFSITELMITVAIIVIMSAILVPNYQSFKKQLALERSATKLAQDIRRAQEMAIAAEEYPRVGYGIYSEEDGEEYFLYADTSENESFDPGETVEVIELEKDIFISAINTPDDTVSINFKPPDPIIKISEGETILTNVIITLCIKRSGCIGAENIETVFVNKVGLIDVD